MTPTTFATAVLRTPVVVKGGPLKTVLPNLDCEDLITRHWDALAGAPGAVQSGLEDVGGGHRIRYANGAIYISGPGGTPAWVYGAIGDRYHALGGATSWLGLPISDEADFTDGGRFNAFEFGAIYFWPDTGAIELGDLVVRYTGLVCFGETDWDQSSSADEPYAILGVISPSGDSTATTKIYGEPTGIGGDGGPSVDAGQSRPDSMELYRGKPGGLSIGTLLMEHDFGRPPDYLPAMNKAIAEALKGAAAAVRQIPVFGPVFADLVEEIPVAPVAEAIASALDLKDDVLAQATIQMSAKQMVLLAARTDDSTENSVRYKAVTPILSGQGASYKVYFGVDPVQVAPSA